MKNKKEKRKMKKLLMTVGAAAVVCCALLHPLFAGVQLPIVGWGGYSQEEATVEKFLEAKDAGFTHLTQWCETPADARRALDEAEKAGIKLIVGLGNHYGLERMSAEAEAFTAAVKDSPALEYYYITDEPHIKLAEKIRDCVKRYEELDTKHPCYVNLFGAMCDRWNRNDVKRQRKYTGCDTVEEYLRRFYDIVPLKMVSFDFYPVLSFKPLMDGDFRLHGQRVFLKERWYETLEKESAIGRERKIPMFAFVLATAHRHYPENDYPVPTMAHMRLQLYSNLAYGAQGIQYFKYVQQREYSGFNNAPILVNGRRSPVFDLVRELNKEIQARAFVFRGADVQGVWHTGLDIPLGTKRFEPNVLPPFVKTFSTPKGDTAVVSWLKNGNKDYVVVVNRDPNEDISFAATFEPGTEVVRRDGTRANASAYEDYFWLEPGDAAIFAAP